MFVYPIQDRLGKVRSVGLSVHEEALKMLITRFPRKSKPQWSLYPSPIMRYNSGDKFKEVGFNLLVTLRKQEPTEPDLLARKGHSPAVKSSIVQRRTPVDSLCRLAIEDGSNILH